MAYLNANIPATYAQIKREYLYDLKSHHGEVEDCVIFGITAITGRPILFHAIMENGAIFYRLPISAFIQKWIFASLEVFRCATLLIFLSGQKLL